MKKLYINLIIITILSFALPVISSAQGGGVVGGSPPCGPPFGSPSCPIDGGISFLIAAGLAFGGKKANDLRKQK